MMLMKILRGKTAFLISEEYFVLSKYLFFLLPFFLDKKAAFHIGIDINIDGRHADGFEADNAAAVREFLFICDIKMLAGKTVDMLHSFIVVICHLFCPKT